MGVEKVEPFSVVFSKEEVKRYFDEELASREEVREWRKSFKDERIPYPMRYGLALFLKAANLTLDEFLDIHREWLKDIRQKSPTAKLMDDYAKYLLEKIKWAEEQGWKGRNGNGVSQSILSLMHTGPRSFISSVFGKRNGIPCANLPDYNKVEVKTYHPPLGIIRELCDVSDIVGRWIIIAGYQMPARIGDLAKLKYTEDIERQINEILEGVDPDKSEVKAVIIEYTPEKGHRVGGKSAGRRILCFFGDAFDIFLQYREKVGLKVGDYLFKGYEGKVKHGAYREEMLRRYFNNAAKIIRLQERVGKSKAVRFHGLRGAGIQAWNQFDKLMGDYMSGHILPGVGENYYSERDLYKACKRLYYELNPYAARDRKYRTFEQTVKETEETVQRLKAENASLREEIREIRRFLAQGNLAQAFQTAVNGNNLSEIEELKRENQELRQQVAELTQLVKNLLEAQGKAAPQAGVV